MSPWLFLLTALAVPNAAAPPSLQNTSFESASQNQASVPGWLVLGEQAGDVARIDETQSKEGRRALLIENNHQSRVSAAQDLLLPVGTTWKASVWARGEVAAGSGASGALEVNTPAGGQGKSFLPSGKFSWQQSQVVFRVPSPGRVRLDLVSNSPGKLWFDEVQLEPFAVAQDPDVHIRNTRISRTPIDVKQGGQFIEPLCHLLPSMLAQQVAGGSFEEEPPCQPSYKRGVDWPHRPWYPDGAVEDATFTLDTAGAYNGKRSERIDLPMTRARAGISQDGYYLKQGMSYRLHLHIKGMGQVPVWASLRGGGGLIAGPVLIGRTSDNWHAATILLRANRTISNATLTLEFEGPGSLWLDRISLIGDDAVLGLWRPDVVQALKGVNPGVIRFGGSVIHDYDWKQSIGPSDQRVPFVTGPWGGLDPNFVGVDEFVQLARYVGAEPLICVRWIDRKPADAAAEVEYLNGSVKTRWGAVRARNGHPEPYRVKYFQVGNEVSGPEYDSSIQAFGRAMLKVDPTIKIMSSFPSSNTLKEDGGTLDYLCPHHYRIGDLPAEKADFDSLKALILKDGRGKDIRVAVTEWNTTAGNMGLTRGMLLTLGNALSTSRYQNLLHRYADLVEIAVRSNLSDSFASGMIQPELASFYLTPAYYSQKLYQEAAGTYPLEVSQSGKIPWQLRDPDLSATLSRDGKLLRIFAVNSTADGEKVHIHLDGFSSAAAGGEITVLKDRESARDSEAMNSKNDPERIITFSHSTQLKGSELPVSFEPFSVTMIQLRMASEAR